MFPLKVFLWGNHFFAKRICFLQSTYIYCEKKPRHDSKQPGPCPARPAIPSGWDD